MKEGFEMAVAALGIEEEVSDEGDTVTFFQLKGEGSCDGIGLSARGEVLRLM
ncbi:hypothetical protein OAE58_02405 [Akkermansiaceae bacterium]|nr:hypothetical protein [Akkermansiaceae bacterium]